MVTVNVSAEFRDSAWVPRWSIIRAYKKQSVAEHAYFVTATINDMLSYLGAKVDWYPQPMRVLEMLQWGLHHDVAEVVTGDITGPVKQAIIDPVAYKAFVKEREDEIVGWSPSWTFEHCFSKQEQLVCEVADKLESLIFVYDEIKGGNRQLLRLRDSLEKTLRAKVTKHYQQCADVNAPWHAAVETYINESIAANTRDSKVNHYPSP